MVKCSFSGKEIPKGTGIMYVKDDGKVLHFIDRKSERNWEMRSARNVGWTEESRKLKAERMAALKHAEAKKSEE